MYSFVKNKDHYLEVLHPLSKELNMDISVTEDKIALSNAHCSIIFCDEEYSLEANFYLAKDPGFLIPVTSLSHWGFDDWNNFVQYENIDIKYNKLEYLLLVIRRYLSESIISNNFSWMNIYKIRIDFEGKLLGLLYNLDNTHDIRIKYAQGDPTWRTDLLNTDPTLMDEHKKCNWKID